MSLPVDDKDPSSEVHAAFCTESLPFVNALEAMLTIEFWVRPLALGAKNMSRFVPWIVYNLPGT